MEEVYMYIYFLSEKAWSMPNIENKIRFLLNSWRMYGDIWYQSEEKISSGASHFWYCPPIFAGRVSYSYVKMYIGLCPPQKKQNKT